MKNPLAVVAKNEIVKKSVDSLSHIILEHENTVLTGTTVAFNAVGIALTYRNSPKIHQIIEETRTDLQLADDEETKKKIIKRSFKDLSVLVAPIIISFSASTASAILNQKKSEAKIATLTAALSLAQSTVSEYGAFKDEVRKEIGDEKYQTIKDEITKERIDQSFPTNFQVEMGDQLCYIPDWDIFFSSTEDKIKLAFEHVNAVLNSNGIDGNGYGNESYRGNEIVLWSDLLRELKVKNAPTLANELGWEAGRVKYISYWVGSGTRNGVPYLTVEIGTSASKM